MPPKRVLDSEEDSQETSTASSDMSEDSHMQGATGFTPGGPPQAYQSSQAPTGLEGYPPQMDGAAGGAHRGSTGALLQNNPHDEEFPVAADQEHIRTPTQQPPVLQLANDPNDEVFHLDDGESVPTPHDDRNQSPAPVLHAAGLASAQAPLNNMRPQQESSDDDDDEEDESYEAGAGDRMNPQGNQRTPNHGGSSDGHRQGYSTSPTQGNDTELDGNSSPQSPTTEGQSVRSDLSYNPAAYAKINSTASREIQDLFKQIVAYKPYSDVLPAKLRPFIPDYIPAVGDIDPFIKIPRPDGRPDGLGLYIVDEPAVPQSNPAVVLLELRATNAHDRGGSGEVVDSFEDAAKRPEVIDKWISDVKKVHYKKPLPVVNYHTPMPDIETLLQVWPPEVEEILNSDIAFPPPQIDLDIEQYIKLLCAMLDIPTHNSLIDSLHVMFTLYQEFRANQHFQHE